MRLLCFCSAVLIALGGCAQLPVTLPLGQASEVAGPFIDSDRARPLSLKPINDSVLLNNKLIDIMAGDATAKDEPVRGFGTVNLVQQMSQVDRFYAPEMERYCRDILDKLLAHWRYEKPTVQLHFSASESFGALASGDDTIYLNLGLLQGIESEDELAAVLGHELAHLLLGHFDREHFFNQQKKLVEASVNAVNMATLFAGLESTGSTGQAALTLSDPEAVGDTLVKSTVSGMLLKEISNNLWNSSWTRAQEDEADLLSVDLLVRAGYNPRGSVHSLQRLRNFEDNTPSLLGRYQAQQKQLFSQAYARKGLSGVVEQTLYSGLMSATLAGKDAWDTLGKTHHSPAVREQRLMRYIAREYRQERRRPLREGAYQQHLLTGKTGPVIADHVLINRATKALQLGDMAQAKALSQQVLNGPAASSMRAQTLRFLLTIREGKSAQALKQMEQVPASEWTFASLATYDQVISLALYGKRQAQAEQVLSYGQQVWGEQLMAPLAISVALAGKRIEQAQQAYQRCTQDAPKALLAQCEQAIGEFKPTKKAPESAPGLLNSLKSSLSA